MPDSQVAVPERVTKRRALDIRNRISNLFRRGWRGRWATLGVALVVVLAACGGGSGSDSATDSRPSAAERRSAADERRSFADERRSSATESRLSSSGSSPSGGDVTSNSSPSLADNPADPSKLAPDIDVTLYQGSDELGSESLSISGLRGKPLVINFWAGLCPPCRAEMPDFQEFYDENKERVTLVGIDVGQFTGLGDQDAAKALLKELGVTYPAGFTEDASVMRDYKVLAMPTTVFISSNGELFRTWGGVLNSEKLAEVTNDMLRQEPNASN